MMAQPIRPEIIDISDDEGDAPSAGPAVGYEAAFNAYINAHDVLLPDGLVVTFWGVRVALAHLFAVLTSSQANQQRLPVWASLAADYLPVMASSVSSERVFSQAGLLITKRRTLLKADIIEAIQMVKYRLKEGTCLELQDASPSLDVEATIEALEQEELELQHELEVPQDLALDIDNDYDTD